MPKSFTAVSAAAITLVVFGLFMSPRVMHPTVQTAASAVAATTSASATVQKTIIQRTVPPSIQATTTEIATASTSDPIATSTATSTPETNATLSIAGTSYGVVSGQSVLDTMRTLQSNGTMSFTETDYPGLGAFIDSINGKANANGLYWFLYVNGKPSGMGATQTIVHQGDTVEWKYSDSY